MFSGIVETTAQVVKIETEQTNKHFALRNPFGEALTIDQSIAHNGVCLTVVKIEGDLYTVTAMQETLRLTNLDLLKVGDYVNEGDVICYIEAMKVFNRIKAEKAGTITSINFNSGDSVAEDDVLMTIK
jgi:riboflavin synthase alpha subunit